MYRLWNTIAPRTTFLKGRKFSSNIIEISEEVREALHYGKPVVALESTIITHGMPHPQNLQTALSVEKIVRENGATPATIGILGGKVRVGLSTMETEYLADPATSAIKTSRRDFPGVISLKLNGGTTVSGTMVVAEMVGIQIFVTGGIGGVHHGVQETMDISADLTELGRTPITVISSGIKSILDIGKSLEYLETEGVAVATYSSSREFPAFFTPHSGFQVPYNLTNPTQAAHFIEAHMDMHLKSGILIGVPIPESDATSGEIIQLAIDSAVLQAKKEKISGKDVTPFILEKVNELTGGASLEANMNLIQNNARVGSQIAYKLSKLIKSKRGRPNPARVTKHTEKTEKTDVVVIGGSIVDFYARVNSDNFQSNGATYPGGVDQSFGGVGRNLADGLTRLGVNTLFISAIGKDSHRAGFKSYCSHMNLEAVLELEGQRTATYCAVLQKGGQLLFGIGDMDIHRQITPEYIEKYRDIIEESRMVCIDGNVTVEALRWALQITQAKNIPVCFEPTDIHKASKPFQVNIRKAITMATPNLNELRTMYKFLTGSLDTAYGCTSSDNEPLNSVLMESVLLSKVIALHIPTVIVTLGKHGMALCQRHKTKKPDQSIILKDGSYLTVDWYSAVPKGQEPDKIVSVSGAGDCLVSAIVSGIVRSRDLDLSIKQGLRAAQLSLQSHHAVPASLSQKQIELTDDVWKQLTCTRITEA